MFTYIGTVVQSYLYLSSAGNVEAHDNNQLFKLGVYHHWSDTYAVYGETDRDKVCCFVVLW